jgi:hypothetical protein
MADNPAKAPCFIAYVYPGWHADGYRPGIDEWKLLDNFRPNFEGHSPPPRPLSGPYDDSDLATSKEHISLASSHGITVFWYFTYYGPNGFVMASPMETTLAVSNQIGNGITVGASWCVRLPHDRFPVAPRDELEHCALPPAPLNQPLKDTPIELSSLEDIEALLGKDDRIWTDFVFIGNATQTGKWIPTSNEITAV